MSAYDDAIKIHKEAVATLDHPQLTVVKDQIEILIEAVEKAVAITSTTLIGYGGHPEHNRTEEETLRAIENMENQLARILNGVK